jgi:hypothetical protein
LQVLQEQGARLHFTEGASHSECRQEYSYEAKWKQKNLNTVPLKIYCPHVCHLYFSSRNAVFAVLNQSLQSKLAIEKYWITHNGFFRIIATTFGVMVVGV